MDPRPPRAVVLAAPALARLALRRLNRLPANRVLQDKIGYLFKRPVGRPPQEVRRYYASFRYQAGSWTKPRRVVAKSLPLRRRGSSGIRVSFIRASALSLPTWRGRWSVSS